MAFVRKVKIGNRTYFIEGEGYRDEDGKVRQRFRCYLGKLEGGKLIEPKYKRLEIKRLFPAGIQLMVRALVEKHGLRRHFSLKPVRVWWREHLEGHLRVCYLLYTILTCPRKGGTGQNTCEGGQHEV